MQSGKKLRLSQPQQMLAAEREIIDEAYAGAFMSKSRPAPSSSTSSRRDCQRASPI